MSKYTTIKVITDDDYFSDIQIKEAKNKLKRFKLYL